MVSCSLVVSPLTGSQVSQFWLVVIAQLRIPPPVLVMIKVMEVEELPKSRVVVEIESWGSGVESAGLLSSLLQPDSARRLISAQRERETSYKPLYLCKMA